MQSSTVSRDRLDEATLPMLTVGLDGRVWHLNAALCQLLGRKTSDAVGRRIGELCGDETALGDMLSAAAAGTAGGELTQRLPTVDDRWVTVRVSWSLERATSGEPVSVTAVLVKVAAGSQKTRAQRQRLYDAITRPAGDVAVVCDAEGHLVHAAPSLTSLLGYRPDEVVGRLLCDFSHPDDKQDAQTLLRAVVGDGQTRSAVLRVQAADAAWYWVELTVTNLISTGLGGLVCDVYDVTERFGGQHDPSVTARHEGSGDSAPDDAEAAEAAGMFARPERRSRSRHDLRTEHGMDRLLLLHREGASPATVAAALNAEGFRRPSGLRWHRTSVVRALAELGLPSVAAPD